MADTTRILSAKGASSPEHNLMRQTLIDQQLRRENGVQACLEDAVLNLAALQVWFSQRAAEGRSEGRLLDAKAAEGMVSSLDAIIGGSGAGGGVLVMAEFVVNRLKRN